MKTKIICSTALVLFFTISSCYQKNEQEAEKDYITDLLKHIHLADNVHWVVLLPGLGCHGCIQEGEQFMKDNVNNRDIYFVLTRIESLKILQNKIGIELKNQPNIYADKDNRINIPGDHNIYPCIVQLNKGDIKTYEFQSPENGQAFANLQARLEFKASK